MKRYVLIVAGLVCGAALLPVSASAGDLLEAYTLARQNDPQLKAADANRLARSEAYPQGRSALLPTLGVSANTTDNSQETISAFAFNPSREEDFNTHGYSLTLTQPVYHHDYWVALRQANSTVKQAETDYASAEQDLIVRVAGRYFDVLSAQDSLDFANAEKESTARQLEQAKQRFEVGLIAITDVHEAQAQYDLTVAQAIQAENALANAREALQEILGQYMESVQRLQTEIPLITPEPASPSEWADKAAEQNLSIRSAQFALDIAREEINRQRAGHYPTLDIVATHSDSSSNSSFGSDRETGTIGLQLDVPLFQGGYVNSKTREAAYRHSESKFTLEQTRRNVLRQTRDAYLGVIAGISRVKALNQAVISSEKALEATQAGFEVGTRTIVDVLVSQSQLYAAKRDYARTRYDYILNTLNLKQAAGTLSEQDLQQINSWIE
ncbi:MAG: TolC family outer membrane protein [Granulosicoccaceae bacterium]|jgi:outer membrane protein